MTRKEMVTKRAEKLSQLSDMQLIDTIVKYFEQNATMPGEKALKDYATSLKNEFDGNAITGLLSEVRKDLIEQFASLCVKEVRIKPTVANDTKKNKEAKKLLASDLPMELTDIIPVPVPVNTTKNVYVMAASISGENGIQLITESIPSYELGSFPAGFIKNHKTLEGMKGVVIATDYSNGKFANMSYKMLIDLGQSIAA